MSALDMTFYSPAVLARHLAALDLLAAARPRLGLGSAWSVAAG